MTVLGIIITFVIGFLILFAGIKTKKIWLKIIALIPLSISIFNIIMLYMIYFFGY